MMKKIDPIISLIYWYYLKTDGSFEKQTVVLAFLFEAGASKRAINFVKKYAADDTELKIIANHCKKNKNGKYDIDWEAVEDEMQQKGIGDYE